MLYFLDHTRTRDELSIVKFVLPSAEKDIWEGINAELRDKLHPYHHHLARLNNAEDIADMGNQINSVIRDFLLERPELFDTIESENSSKAAFINHPFKTLEQAKKAKNYLRKKAFGRDGTKDDKKRFYEAVKAVSELKKKAKKKEEIKTAKWQEDLYFKNKWEFAKHACNGTIGSKSQPPGFSKAEADTYYPQHYSIPKEIDFTSLNWFPYLPDSQNDSFEGFNLDPIKISYKDILSTLANSNKKSSPGPDGVTYGILYKLPTTHHIMATLFNKVLQFGSPPCSLS